MEQYHTCLCSSYHWNEWCHCCGSAALSVHVGWWSPACTVVKGASTTLGAQVEGKTLRHVCQKHVGERRGRTGARSGYCWALLVDCPKIRARCQVLWWDVMPCWNVCDITEFTFPSHDSALCLAVSAIWQPLPLILQQKSRQKIEVFKGKFLWVDAARLFPGSYNQLLKWKKARKSLWAVFSTPFSHLSLLGSLMSLCMSGLWLQSFLSTPCGGSPRLVGM